MAKRRKTGGRIAGTPNKITADLREQLRGIVETTLAELPETLAVMDPVERAKLLTALLPYVMPKLNSIELKAEKQEDQPKKSKPEWLGIAASKIDITPH